MRRSSFRQKNCLLEEGIFEPRRFSPVFCEVNYIAFISPVPQSISRTSFTQKLTVFVTTTGIPLSRAIIARWERSHPFSVIIPSILSKYWVSSGESIFVQSIRGRWLDSRLSFVTMTPFIFPFESHFDHEGAGISELRIFGR